MIPDALQQDWIAADEQPIDSDTIELEDLTVRVTTWAARARGPGLSRRMAYFTFVEACPSSPLEGQVVATRTETIARWHHARAVIAVLRGARHLDDVAAALP